MALLPWHLHYSALLAKCATAVMGESLQDTHLASDLPKVCSDTTLPSCCMALSKFHSMSACNLCSQHLHWTSTSWLIMTHPHQSIPCQHVIQTRWGQYTTRRPAHFAGPILRPTDVHEPDEEAGQAGLRLLAHSLVEFAAQQGLRLDPFALGPASRVVGKPHAAGLSHPLQQICTVTSL